MRIGIDIDDTMTNHCETWFNAYNKYYKLEGKPNLSVNDAYKWSFYEDWDENDKNLLMLAMHSEYYFDNITLLPNVKKVIEEILSSENEVVIISSTYKEFQEQKKNWLLNQLPMLKEDDIIFTVQKERINVDVMIEDNLDYAKKFNCPFLLFNRPWNSNRPDYEYSDNIIRVGNWKDIEEILIQMGAINIQFGGSTDETFSEATQQLINGIKEAKTDKECIDLLNPYIKMWQQQGMLIGMKQINDATMLVVEDIIKEINAKK